MTTTYTGNTPATTTDYRPHPERTDSEFNVLQQAYAQRGVELERLTERYIDTEERIDHDDCV